MHNKKRGFITLFCLLSGFMFGQIDLPLPADKAEVFFPGIISTTNHEHSSPTIKMVLKMICIYAKKKEINEEFHIVWDYQNIQSML